MVKDKQALRRLQERLLEAAKSNWRILVVGWKGSNHNKETRALEKAKLVEFVSKVPLGVSKETMVIFTPFSSHSDKKRAERRTESSFLFAIKLGEIRKVLKVLLPLIEEKRSVLDHPESSKPTESREEAPVATGLLLQPQVEVPGRFYEDPRVLAFGQGLCDLLGNDPSMTVSKYAASNLLREHFLEREFSQAVVPIFLLR